MVKLINKKINGATILEPLVAVVIISGVITMSSIIFGNIASSDLGYLKFKGENEIDKLMISSDYEENEDFTYDSYVIEKSVDYYDGFDDVIEVCWVVKEKESKDIILEKCFLLND